VVVPLAVEAAERAGAAEGMAAFACTAEAEVVGIVACREDAAVAGTTEVERGADIQDVVVVLLAVAVGIGLHACERMILRETLVRPDFCRGSSASAVAGCGAVCEAVADQ